MNISANTTTTTTMPTPYTTNPRMVNGIIILILMIFIILGNGLVYYVYRNYFKVNIFTFFVKVLAAMDLLTAFTTMPIDVMVKLRPLDEDQMNLDFMCKVSHFAVYSSHLLSVCVLTFISYQRYMKVCHPLKPGFDLRQAKIIVWIAGACCTVFCIFSLVMMGRQDIRVQVREGLVVNVTICRFEKQYDGTPVQIAFHHSLFAIFVVALLSMFFFYILIARELRRFEKRNSEVFMSVPTTPDTHSVHSAHDLRHGSYVDKNCVLATRMDKISTHMYKVFAIITLIFILSYLPHLVVLILQEVLHLDDLVLTYAQRALVEVAYNSPYISSVVNPIVYGFSNAEFRGHCRDLLTCKIFRGGSSFY
ncbi:neuropeptide FF receptor 2 [Biomphalaria glabrata]|uniref:QRFP-like peptide receptor n=1 Tax=Biomphalaria glabrata TaxID=6526 RepID=A0A9W3AUG6_BIOGL|nr:QRFP-like peptide receptor [Biomphalaria glabrata]XP_055890779.1 QRFP-like peptide receptor [Biomphalaria glabrata]KAI8746405.1 neuropeptide FF receptor 2 [Biomphalaria glabrata]KAI8763536.1 neuropeptide FF receptor 2-like [Biomphalaria glabrata]